MPVDRQKILMCAPDFFGVDYEINAWMMGNVGKTLHDLAVVQWHNLQRNLCDLAAIDFVMPQQGLPDLVFTANAGLVFRNKVIVSRFAKPERQGEEPFFRQWFVENGFNVLDWPEDIPFEGAGDALFNRDKMLFLWVAHGFRSAKPAAKLIEKLLGVEVETLRLVDPRFYHLDTCFCPLEGGFLMYFPDAFDEESQQKIAALVPEQKRIVVTEEDAVLYCCNAVELSGKLFLNDASENLQQQLAACGLRAIITPVSEFLKSGGGTKCLTLKLREHN